jgi:hypothetical protein
MDHPQGAVLTGDIVGSTGHQVRTIDAAMHAIRDAGGRIAAWQTPNDDARFTRFRGDGWQIMLTAPAFSLRAAVVIQARLVALGLESRISIGIGRLDSLGTADLSDAAGEAFELSGRGLDQMADSFRLAIDGTSILAEDSMIADLLGERMGRWTAAQAEAAGMQLACPTRVTTLHEIGARLGISPQAVSDRIRGAGAGTIASVLRRWEAAKAGSEGNKQP